jgi:hypothetical protein
LIQSGPAFRKEVNPLGVMARYVSQDAIKLEQWFVVDADSSQIPHRNAALLQTILDRSGRKTATPSGPGKPLLLRSGDDVAVLHQRRYRDRTPKCLRYGHRPSGRVCASGPLAGSRSFAEYTVPFGAAKAMQTAASG